MHMCSREHGLYAPLLYQCFSFCAWIHRVCVFFTAPEASPAGWRAGRASADHRQPLRSVSVDSLPSLQPLQRLLAADNKDYCTQGIYPTLQKRFGPLPRTLFPALSFPKLFQFFSLPPLLGANLSLTLDGFGWAPIR